MLQEDYEAFIAKVEAGFKPNFEGLQQAVLDCAQQVKDWLELHPTYYLHDFMSGDVVPPEAWDLYLKAKATLKKAVDDFQV